MEYGYKVKFKNPSLIVCIMTEYSADVKFTCNERRKKKIRKCVAIVCMYVRASNTQHKHVIYSFLITWINPYSHWLTVSGGDKRWSACVRYQRICTSPSSGSLSRRNFWNIGPPTNRLRTVPWEINTSRWWGKTEIRKKEK